MNNPNPQQPVYQQAPIAPLRTNRSLAKMIFLSLITFGIYGLWLMTTVSTDINTIASRYDGKKTMHFLLLLFIIGPITLCIGYLVWNHRLANRIGAELQRRSIAYPISASSFWGWGFFGTLIVVGPFIYYHKILTGMNLLSESYNQIGF